MTVLLKNLVARIPTERDLAALGELVRACEGDAAQALLEGLRARWQGPDFHRTNDAWAIVTTAGDLVGFASVWYEAPERLATYLCVHPAYRQRGIGTLLLRMAEVWARQQVRQFPVRQRIVLQGTVLLSSQAGQHLFEREGYQAGRAFLRISFEQREESERRERALDVPARVVEIGLDRQAQACDFALPGERDGLCSISLHRTYEKELRPASSSTGGLSTGLQAVGA